MTHTVSLAEPHLSMHTHGHSLHTITQDKHISLKRALLEMICSVTRNDLHHYLQSPFLNFHLNILELGVTSSKGTFLSLLRTNMSLKV